jgi:hypothetical protein
LIPLRRAPESREKLSAASRALLVAATNILGFKEFRSVKENRGEVLSRATPFEIS